MLALEGLLHIAHAFADPSTRRDAEHFYLDVFAAQTFFEATPVEGLERAESLILIGGLCLVPVSPTNPDSPQGALLATSAGRFSQIAIKVSETDSVAARLRDHGIEPLYLRPRHQGLFFLTRPAETVNVRFEFCAVTLPNDLRLRPEWSADWWRDHHPLGIEGLGSVVTATADLPGAKRFYEEVLGLEPLGDRILPEVGAKASGFLVGHADPFVLEAWEPLDADSVLAQDVARFGGGVHGITLKVRSLDRSTGYLRSKGVPASGDERRVVIDPAHAHGARFMLVENDPWQKA